jgi:hypothetical protein
MQGHLNISLALYLNDDIQTEFNSDLNAVLDPDLYCYMHYVTDASRLKLACLDMGSDLMRFCYVCMT